MPARLYLCIRTGLVFRRLTARRIGVSIGGVAAGCGQATRSTPTTEVLTAGAGCEVGTRAVPIPNITVCI